MICTRAGARLLNRVGAVDELERRGLSISITAWLQGFVRFALLELLKERENEEDADTLLRKVLERTGHTPSLWMEVVEDRISYFAQWQREYGEHGASDYRTVEGASTSGVLQIYPRLRRRGRQERCGDGAMNQHSQHVNPSTFRESARLTAAHRSMMQQMGMPDGMCAKLRVGMLGKCRVVVAQEGAELRWHLSISHPWRLPTWDEINAARDELIPADVWLCQPMPPKAYWLNIHQHCLHLWEIRDRELIAQWAFDGCGNNAEAERVADLAVRTGDA